MRRVRLQPDGKIVTLGCTITSNFFPGAMFMTRHNADGSLDRNFGGNGLKFLSGFFTDFVLLPDGKMIVTGSGISLERLNADGTSDSTFGANGRISINPGGYSDGRKILRQPDGKIVVVGVSSERGLVVMRFHPDGQLDASFNSNGIFAGNIGFSADYWLYFAEALFESVGEALLQPDGKILIAGSLNDDVAVLRLNTNGSFDQNFGAGGIMTKDVRRSEYYAPNYVGGMALQPDGKIVINGQNLMPYEYGIDSSFILRLNPEGTTDHGFGANGVVFIAEPAEISRGLASALALQENGKILTAGMRGGVFAVARYLANGTLDASFGAGGIVTTQIGADPGFDTIFSLALQPDGKLVAAGSVKNSAGSHEAALARFQTASFALRPNGKIAFTSYRDGNAEIYVMNSDGTGQTRLTNSSRHDDFPTWSPDGRTIAFLSFNAAGTSINLMNPDGTNVRTMYSAGTSIAGISWSPDGTKMAFAASSNIFSVFTDGTGLTNLTNNQYINVQPSWSPDGSQIVFACAGTGSSYGEICAVSSAGGTVRVLTNSFPYTSSATPDWSPDGEKIVFADASQDISANDSITLINPDGAALQRILISGGKILFSPKWSPNGAKIVFYQTNYAYERGQIITINRDGSGETALTNESENNTNPDWQPVPEANTLFDFDGDGRADISVFRPPDQTWYLERSRSGFVAVRFGLQTDRIVPADYDGDGKTDIAVFRDGTWFWINSSDGAFGSFRFGEAGDIPVPSDFSGDGRAELAVFRGGNWFTYNLSNDKFISVRFGLASDKPVAADYDGDGQADYAVFRDGEWYFLRSTLGFGAIRFGLATDTPTPADFDGDGRADAAVYRRGIWYLLQSTQGFAAFQFGLATDTPAPADYDGDGRTDAAVFRQGVWYQRHDANRFSVRAFGLAGDKPVPAAFMP